MNKYIDRWVQAGPNKTRYLTAGDGEAVIFLHGGGAGASGEANWSGNLGEVAEAGYAGFAPDIVGFGLTDKTKGWHTYEKKIQHIIAFMDAMCIERASFVGNSMGGGIACGIAAHHPNRVNKIIMLGGGAVKLKVATEKFQSVIDYEPSLESMSTVLKSFCFDESLVTEELIEGRYQMSILPGAQESYRDFMSIVLNSGAFIDPLQKILKNTDIPFMMIWGRDDKIVPLKYGHEMEELIPSAEFNIYDNCGHWAQIECRERFNKDLATFLKS